MSRSGAWSSRQSLPALLRRHGVSRVSLGVQSFEPRLLEVLDATRAALEGDRGAPAVTWGIHTHNDAELAVANAIAAVQAGVRHVQATINGYGERCGNANLCSLIPVLQLKMGMKLVPDEQLQGLTDLSHYVAELANVRPEPRQPFVGLNAFTHKAGLHADAMGKVEESYQHIPPQSVGNRKRILVSELAGKSNIVQKAEELGLNLDANDPRVRAIVNKVKEMEQLGYQYEGAEASFEMLVRRMEPDYRAPFDLVDFMVVVEKHRRASTRATPERIETSTTPRT